MGGAFPGRPCVFLQFQAGKFANRKIYLNKFAVTVDIPLIFDYNTLIRQLTVFVFAK